MYQVSPEELYQQEIRKQKSAERGATIGAFVCAISLAFFSMPFDLGFTDPQFWQFSAIYLGLEVGRGLALLVNVRIEKVSGEERWRPLIILLFSIAVSLIIAVALIFHFEPIAVRRGIESGQEIGFWQLAEFWFCQGLNIMVFVIELSLAFLKGQAAERYGNLQEELKNNRVQLDSIRLQLDSIRTPLDSIRLHLGDFYGNFATGEDIDAKVLRKTLHHLELSRKVDKVHEVNMRVLDGKALSIKKNGDKSGVKVYLCDDGTLIPANSNADKSCMCPTCGKTHQFD